MLGDKADTTRIVTTSPELTTFDNLLLGLTHLDSHKVRNPGPIIAFRNLALQRGIFKVRVSIDERGQ